MLGAAVAAKGAADRPKRVPPERLGRAAEERELALKAFGEIGPQPGVRLELEGVGRLVQGDPGPEGRDRDAQELQDQPGLERAEQPRIQMKREREDEAPGGGPVKAREHFVDAPERLPVPVLEPELDDEPPARELARAPRLGLPDGRRSRVDPFEVERRAPARGPRRGHIDAVLAQAGGKLRQALHFGGR